jgi:pentatricopeptide repeat protein
VTVTFDDVKGTPKLNVAGPLPVMLPKSCDRIWKSCCFWKSQANDPSCTFQMLENGHTPSRETYLYLIKASIAGGQFEQAPVWLEEMRKRGIEREIFTYNTLIRGYTERKRMQELEVVRVRTARFDLIWRRVQVVITSFYNRLPWCVAVSEPGKAGGDFAGVGCALQAERSPRKKCLRAALSDYETASRIPPPRPLLSVSISIPFQSFQQMVWYVLQVVGEMLQDHTAFELLSFCSEFGNVKFDIPNNSVNVLSEPRNSSYKVVGLRKADRL